MNVKTTRIATPKQAVITAAKPQAKEATTETPKDTLTISLPSPGYALRKSAHFVAGTASLVWRAPEIIGSPVVNAFNPTAESSAAGSNEITGKVVGGALLGIPIGMGVAMLQGGSGTLGALAGAGIGLMGGMVKMMGTMMYGMMSGKFLLEPTLPNVADVAFEAHQQEEGPYAKGTAIRRGIPVGAKDAYLNGGKAVDASIDFTRGLIGLKK